METINNEITAIEIGVGQGSSYYKIGNAGVSEIKECKKDIGPGLITVYRVYSKSGIICEIESGKGITLYY